jgi:hypothetical protein
MDEFSYAKKYLGRIQRWKNKLDRDKTEK